MPPTCTVRFTFMMLVSCVEQKYNRDFRPVDLVEQEVVDTFVQDTCGCKLLDSGSCSLGFTKQHIGTVRDQCLSLDHQLLDSLLMGQIMAGTNVSLKARVSGPTTHSRQKPHTKFYHGGHRVHSKNAYVILTYF